MVIERRWKKWVFFYIPLTVFVVGTLFPFYWMFVTAIRPDSELYRSWRAVNNAPFWTLHPTLEHFQDLMAKTTFPVWLWNTFFIAVVSTLISLFCGLLAGIFAFTLSWNEFFYALVFLSSPERKTVPVGVVSELIRGDIYFWGQLMAGALLGSIPVALVYSFFVEYYVTGLTGSVKG